MSSSQFYFLNMNYAKFNTSVGYTPKCPKCKTFLRGPNHHNFCKTCFTNQINQEIASLSQKIDSQQEYFEKEIDELKKQNCELKQDIIELQYRPPDIGSKNYLEAKQHFELMNSSFNSI